ncbi:lipopolysaccharide biosynthesis protein [Protofrankia symbiont of Coriaria ruscifolia]|uniref:lipopolysaccharide biosynthesis protein n=1 Tax=Protofrankia symbiont of Coriaria ruscifolia TaxID=1306542 RepID=UPI001040E82B|nr:polysaccharide biosynthesis protein [Protofrankia symbiont of Coriaria ruscifolia]
MTNVRREVLARVLQGPGSLAAAGVAVNGGNLLANLVFARALDATNYGALVVQTGIFLILSMGGSALQVAVVQRDTSTPGNTRHQRGFWIRRLRGVCAVGAAVTCVLGLLAASPTATVLSYPHPLAIAEAIAAAGMWLSLSVERGLLQARGAYQELARNFVLEGVVRITVTIGLVSAGFGVNGAGLGLIVSVLLATEHARRRTARTSWSVADARRTATHDGTDGPDHIDSTGPMLLRPTPTVRTRHALRRDTTTALAALVPLAMLQNMDVVIVGWLNPASVGAYAAIATACKVPVFIGLAVANFLLPEAARRRQQGRPATAALLVAVGWVVTPGLLLVAIGGVAARFLLSEVFGPGLTGGASALWVLALAMTCLAVTLLFTNYLLGAGCRGVVGVLAAGTVLTGGGLVMAGGDLVATAVIALGCQAVTASLAGFMVLRTHSPAALGTTAGVPLDRASRLRVGIRPDTRTGGLDPDVDRQPGRGSRRGLAGIPEARDRGPVREPGGLILGRSK